MDVYLAIGHGLKPDGRQDPGATAGDKSEQSEGALIVATAGNVLAGLGYEVHDQAIGDPAFEGTIAEVNADPPRLLVSVHHDWRGAPRGAFGFWHPDSRAGKAAADHLYAAVSAAGFPMRHGWHKPRGELAILRHTTCPAVLWECDRIGEVTDHAAYGRALAAGIDAALDKRAGDTNDQEDDDMSKRLSDADQQWLAEFVAEARTTDGRPTSLWHVLRFYRMLSEASPADPRRGREVGRWLVEKLTGRAAPTG